MPDVEAVSRAAARVRPPGRARAQPAPQAADLPPALSRNVTLQQPTQTIVCRRDRSDVVRRSWADRVIRDMHMYGVGSCCADPLPSRLFAYLLLSNSKARVTTVAAPPTRRTAAGHRTGDRQRILELHQASGQSRARSATVPGSPPAGPRLSPRRAPGKPTCFAASGRDHSRLDSRSPPTRCPGARGEVVPRRTIPARGGRRRGVSRQAHEPKQNHYSGPR